MIKPPRVGPSTMPTETMPPLTPKARPRSLAGNASVTMARPKANVIAPPMACTTLKAMSQ